MAQTFSKRTLVLVAVIGGVTICGLVVAVFFLIAQLNKERGSPAFFGDTASMGPMAVLPSSVPTEDRHLHWYAIGDEALALVSTVKIGDSGSARFRILDNQGRLSTVSVDQGARVPTLTALTLVSLGGGQARLMSADQVFDMRTAEVSSAIRLAPSSSGGEALRLDRGDDMLPGAEVGAPKDPRIAAGMSAPVLPPPSDPRGAKSDTAEDTGEQTFSVPDGEWRQFLVELKVAFGRDVVLRDTFDANLRGQGAEIARMREETPFLSDYGFAVGQVIVAIEGEGVHSRADADRVLANAPFRESADFLLLDRGVERSIRIVRETDGK